MKKQEVTVNGDGFPKVLEPEFFHDDPENTAEQHSFRRYNPFEAGIGDNRFQRVLGAKNWQQLPKAIRKRFGKRVGPGQSIAYQGLVTRMWFSKPGWALAQFARLIGAPLPYDKSSVGQPTVVCVTEDAETNGQFWIRQYGRKNGFPQVVHSSKRFDGPTGVEEYIGCSIGMALKLEAAPDTLFFKSDHYFLQVFGRRWRIPKLLSPGALVIGHHELGDGYFAFTLHLKHKWFGSLIEQEAVFTDPVTVNDIGEYKGRRN